MLDCKACIRRCIRTLFIDVLDTPQRRQQTHAFQLQRRPRQWPQCMHSTAAAAAAPQDQEPLSTVPVQPPRPMMNQYGEQRVKAIRKGQQFRRHDLEKEMPFLKDPLKLANYILGLLNKDEPKKALEVIRLASKKTACTVSWNHLVDYELSKDRVTAALKLYNEMKKRAQPPDSHTYTILLRGLASHQDYSQTLSRALSVYNSMFAPNSPVKPSITHSNAVLKVCGRRGDIDALYGIAAKLPTHGVGAPDNLTFTTILNAVRHAAWTFNGSKIGETPAETTERRQRAVNEGRRMWDDIIGRWRKGNIWIDEALVCAMGRLQLMGRHPTNLDAVLSLVEQTMAIPRMVPRINDPERSSVAPVPSRLFLSNVQPPTDNEVETNTSALKQEEEEEEEKEKEEGEEEDDDDENLEDDEVQEDAHRRQTDQLQKSQQLNKGLDSFSTNSAVQKPRFPYVLADSEFAPVDISSANFFNAKTRTNQLVAYARPGPNTLSLLLEACIGMRAPAAAQDYWGLLTASASDGGYNVEPDAENYFMYLRLLRLKRASRAAVDLVEEKIGSPDQGVDKSGMLVLGPVEAKHGREMAVAKTFRIAMSVCARDKSNPNALGYATRILRLMQARLPEPDLPALGMYLDVASAAGDRRQAAAGEKVGCKRLLEALNVVELSLQNLKSLLSYGYGDLAVERKWGKEGGAEGKGEANKSQDEGGNDRAPTGTGKRAWGADRKVAAEDAQGSSEKASREQQLKGIRVTDKGRAEVMELVRKLISAYDRVLASGKEELDRTQRYQCLRRKSTWAAYASRYYSHVTKNGVRRGVRRTSRGLKVGRKDGDDEGRGVMKER